MKKILFILIFLTTYFVHAQDSLNFIVSGRVIWLKNLINDISSYPDDYSIENLLGHKATWRGYPYRYPLGALICEIIYEKKGMDGVKALAFSDTEGNLIEVVAKILGIDQEEFEKVVLDYVKEKW